MKRKNKRLSLIAFGLLALGGAAALILMAFEDNIVFFIAPRKLHKNNSNPISGCVLVGWWLLAA